MTRKLRVVIAEDEAVVARRVARLTTAILGPHAGEIILAPSVAEAREALVAAPPDLLILDLELEGEEGFALLRDGATRPFETIVVSAHTDRALEAFEHGVRDFVAKPFGRERLERALHRVLAPSPRRDRPAEYVGVRMDGGVRFVPVAEIVYIQGAGNRSELVLANGSVLLHDRMLDQLEAVLPPRFERIHKSYLVDVRRIESLVSLEGSRYSVVLRGGVTLPVGRTKVATLRQRLA